MIPFFSSLLLVLHLCHASSATTSPHTGHMHVAALSIPAYGHFMPVKGIAEKLLLRGHKVTLFVETPEWCESALDDGMSYNCVVVAKSNTFTRELFSRMSAMEEIVHTFASIFDEMFRHHREQLPTYIEAFAALHAVDPVSMILMDLSTLVGFSLSTKFSVPHVCVFPLTMHMVVGPATYLPSLGTAFSRNMTVVERFINHLVKFAVSASSFSMLADLNAARAAYDIPALTSAAQLAGLDGLIFAPTIWGYDIPQPLCPNIVALGAFSPSVKHTPMETELQVFLNDCTQGTIYVNFGTLAVVGDAMLERVREAIALSTPYCVVWKVSEQSRLDEIRAELPAERPVYLATRFNNPIEIMEHPNTRVFLTHCGDTSVLEAIQSELPLAGIPFFADQADVCQRIEESQIGLYVGHKHRFSVEELRHSLVTLANATSAAPFAQRMRNVHRMSKLLGGAERAARMIEERMSRGLLGANSFLEQCVFLSPGVTNGASILEIQQFDFLFPQILLATAAWFLGSRMLGCCRRRAPTKNRSA